MTRRDRDHYAAKHPTAEPDPRIAAELRSRCGDGILSCRVAAEISADLQVTPAEVGINADLLEIRLVECQLGLFGWTGGGRLVKPAPAVPEELQAQIGERLVNGRLWCLSAWQVADRFGIERQQVADVCESLGIKITSCQLGAF